MLKKTFGVLIFVCLLSSVSDAQYDISKADELGLSAFSPNQNKEKNYVIAVKSFEDLYMVNRKLGNLQATAWKFAGSAPIPNEEDCIKTYEEFGNWIDFEQQFMIVTVRRRISEPCLHLFKVTESSLEDNTLRVVLNMENCYGLAPGQEPRNKSLKSYAPIQVWVTEAGTLEQDENGDKIYPKLEFYEKMENGDLNEFEIWDSEDNSIIGSDGEEIIDLEYSNADLQSALQKAIKWNDQGVAELSSECKLGNKRSCLSGVDYFAHKTELGGIIDSDEVETWINNTKDFIYYKLESGTKHSEYYSNNCTSSYVNPCLTYIEMLALLDNDIAQGFFLKSDYCCDQANTLKEFTDDLRSR